MGSIVDGIDEIQAAIKQAAQKFKSDSQISDFQKTAKEFTKMVESGYATPRGYNIQSFDANVYLKQASH